MAKRIVVNEAERTLVERAREVERLNQKLSAREAELIQLRRELADARQALIEAVSKKAKDFVAKDDDKLAAARV